MGGADETEDPRVISHNVGILDGYVCQRNGERTGGTNGLCVTVCIRADSPRFCKVAPDDGHRGTHREFPRGVDTSVSRDDSIDIAKRHPIR